MAKPQWSARVELFGSPKRKFGKWVLVDPEGLMRVTLLGTASDKEQQALAKKIVELLNWAEE